MEAEQGMFARFLGWKTPDGDPDPEPELGFDFEDGEAPECLHWKVGEVIEVFSSEHSHKNFPAFFWFNREKICLRPTEYKFLPSGPINLDDYL